MMSYVLVVLSLVAAGGCAFATFSAVTGYTLPEDTSDFMRGMEAVIFGGGAALFFGWSVYFFFTEGALKRRSRRNAKESR